MNYEKEKIFIEYITNLYSTDKSYESIGKIIKGVKSFLESDYQVSVKDIGHISERMLLNYLINHTLKMLYVGSLIILVLGTLVHERRKPLNLWRS